MSRDSAGNEVNITFANGLTTDKVPLGINSDIHNSTSPNFDLFGSSGTVNSIDMYYPKTLVDARITEETVELKYIRRAKYSYTQSSFTIAGGYQTYTPDIAIKEIYGCRDGKLTLLKTVQGRVIPPQDIPETLEFDDEIPE
jgi:hypothetical protein